MKPTEWKQYTIKMYKRNKLKKTIVMLDTYKNIREGIINKVIIFENREGKYLDVYYLKGYDKIEVIEE